MNASNLTSDRSSSTISAHQVASEPESQHGKHIFKAVLQLPTSSLQPFLSEAVSKLPGWGRMAAASFCPQPMPQLERSIERLKSLRPSQHLIESDPSIVTPQFLRHFDMIASCTANTPFVKAEPSMHNALATSVDPYLPYKQELELEAPPQKSPISAQPFVSRAPRRRADTGPSIDDTFFLGRRTLGPEPDSATVKPLVARTSLPQSAHGKRNRIISHAHKPRKAVTHNEDRVNGDSQMDVEDMDPVRPKGLSDQQWAKQKKTLMHKADIDTVLKRINKVKYQQASKMQERNRRIDEQCEELVQSLAQDKDSFYERLKRKQERDEKKREQAEEAQKRKRETVRNRQEKKRMRLEKKLSKLKKSSRGADVDDDDDGESESSTEDSEKEETPIKKATEPREEAILRDDDSQNAKRKRVQPQAGSHKMHDDPSDFNWVDKRRPHAEFDPRNHPYPSNPSPRRSPMDTFSRNGRNPYEEHQHGPNRSNNSYHPLSQRHSHYPQQNYPPHPNDPRSAPMYNRYDPQPTYDQRSQIEPLPRGRGHWGPEPLPFPRPGDRPDPRSLPAYAREYNDMPPRPLPPPQGPSDYTGHDSSQYMPFNGHHRPFEGHVSPNMRDQGHMPYRQYEFPPTENGYPPQRHNDSRHGYPHRGPYA